MMTNKKELSLDDLLSIKEIRIKNVKKGVAVTLSNMHKHLVELGTHLDEDRINKRWETDLLVYYQEIRNAIYEYKRETR